MGDIIVLLEWAFPCPIPNLLQNIGGPLKLLGSGALGNPVSKWKSTHLILDEVSERLSNVALCTKHCANPTRSIDN